MVQRNYYLTKTTCKPFGTWDGKHCVIGKTYGGKPVYDANDPLYSKQIGMTLTSHEEEIRKKYWKAFPSFDKYDHFDAFELHKTVEKKAVNLWNKIVEKEFLKIFGREYKPWDYKISSIAREEFSDPVKRKLRVLAFLETSSRHAAENHYTASKYLRKISETAKEVTELWMEGRRERAGEIAKRGSELMREIPGHEESLSRKKESVDKYTERIRESVRGVDSRKFVEKYQGYRMTELLLEKADIIAAREERERAEGTHIISLFDNKFIFLGFLIRPGPEADWYSYAGTVRRVWKANEIEIDEDQKTGIKFAIYTERERRK